MWGLVHIALTVFSTCLSVQALGNLKVVSRWRETKGMLVNFPMYEYRLEENLLIFGMHKKYIKLRRKNVVLKSHKCPS